MGDNCKSCSSIQLYPMGRFNIKTGQLHTQLGVEGFEFEGPSRAATTLLKIFNEEK